MNNNSKKIIAEAISKMDSEQRKDYDECIKKGYKDEFCSKCNQLFLANVHFIRCADPNCPMSNGKSLLDMWKEQLDKDADEKVQ